MKKKRTKKIEQPKTGLPHLLWNEVLDRYLTEYKMDVEHYLDMDEFQIRVIQELKKSFKRLRKDNQTDDE